MTLGNKIIFDVDFCLFDLDGTIIETTEAVEKAWTALCLKHGVDPVELFKHSHGTRTEEVIQRFFPKLNGQLDATVEQMELSIGRDYPESVSLIPGASNLLNRLDKPTEGKFEDRNWAIVTSGAYIARTWFENILKEIGPPKVFITGFDVTKGKPDPQGYAMASERLSKIWNKDPKVVRNVVFEDAPVGIQAGKRIGAITVGITSSYSKETLFAAGADYVVPDLTGINVIQNTPRSIKLEISNPLSK
ncbi:LANO_0H10176g1_1 [Lachancea nothofagi CBS 11611]|uniref:LANO_0H10176g1_1 n=1 Tax=Lachancea nothofagi CBS 11611 TaxID=1266666 RepID=A0A1G4KM31_9SACH|nr:LANO_0H10176g1_1 [Lachancea nothofagi CBS 11611]